MLFSSSSSASLVLLLSVTFLRAGDPPPENIPNHFKPYAFLIGGSWVGRFPDGTASDTQHFEWVYGGKFIRNTHFVTKDGQGMIYKGETIFAWDSQKKRVVYWYWNILGGYSQGVMEQKGRQIISKGVYHGNAKTMETRSGMVLVSENEYRAVQYFQKEGAWQEQWTMTFRRQE